MVEKTKVISVGETQINVEDLPKNVRLLVDFNDQLVERTEETEAEYRQISEDFSFKLSTLAMARNQAQLQLQNMIMEFLQEQATAAPTEEDVESSEEVSTEAEENAE